MVILRRLNNDKLCPILSAKILAQSIEDVPVIVQYNGHVENDIENLRGLSTNMKYGLPIINGFAGNLSTDIIYRLSSNPDIEYISFDARVYSLLDIATSTMEAPFPHGLGYEGEGITVAVIDTGVAPHDDLVKPRNRIVGFRDLVNDKKQPYDDNGHGTQVAGIIAGNGFSSNGKYAGVAPKANILGIKALDKNGGGTTSDIISALSYIVEKKDSLNIDIVNLSLGTPPNNNPAKDPLVRAVEKCVDAGLIVVTAAGNNGPDEKTILSPGTSDNSITVGAVDDNRTIEIEDDKIASFSSRGPTPQGIQKPDLVAPGVNIRSLSNTKLDSYTSLSGTSMATPLISGSIALLLNKNKGLKQKQVKDILLDNCIKLDSNLQSQGAGMLDLRSLFYDVDEENKIKKAPSSQILGEDISDSIIVILIVLFLLDSRW